MESMIQPEENVDSFRSLLLRIHDCASTVGFLSLASATAAHHDDIVKGVPTYRSDIIESLGAELLRAEAEWEAKRPMKSLDATPTQDTVTRRERIFEESETDKTHLLTVSK